MHSIGTGSVRRTSIARPSASGRAAAGKSAGSTEITWFGSRSATRSNQNDEIAVSTRPLSGIGSGQHDVEDRDPVRRDHEQAVVAGVVEVADLAGVLVRQRDGHRSALRRGSSRTSKVRPTFAIARLRSKQRVELLVASSVFGDLRVLAQHVEERPALLPGLQRVALHHPVRVVAGLARLHQREQHRLAEHEAVARVEVLEHPLRIDVHALDDRAELHEHVVREQRTSRGG